MHISLPKMHISQPKCIYLKVKTITLTVPGEVLWPFHAFQSLPGCSLELGGTFRSNIRWYRCISEHTEANFLNKLEIHTQNAYILPSRHVSLLSSAKLHNSKFLSSNMHLGALKIFLSKNINS